MRNALQQNQKPQAIFTCVLWPHLAGLLLAIFGSARFVYAQSTPPLVGAGYRDFYFGTAATPEPTSEKPQSKLWWNDGSWWGSLWNPAAGRYEIHRLDAATQSWIATGTAIDSRSRSRADALWDGRYLYIVSQLYTTTAGPATSWNSGQLFRYSYDAASKSYSLDAGFPVNVNSSKSEALVIDKDSTGKLWVTWVEGGKVKVNRTLGNDLTWGVPFDLPVQGNDTDPDDISTLVAFGGNKIGILWSNQKDSADYFAVHRDGDGDEVWQPRETALSVPSLGAVAEDHLNLKAACDASGNIYAVTVTNLSGSSKPGIFVLKRNAAGVWRRNIFALARLDHTRPVLLINNENQRLYIFARSNETGPGVVYMKSASLNDLQFPGGLGLPVIQSATDVNINNPTVTKQCVDSKTGMLILAADSGQRHYLHSYIDFQASAPNVTSFTPVYAPPGAAVTITGKNFTSTNKVIFNGVAAKSFTVISDTQIRATVPAGAATGKITIINAVDAVSSASDFTVTAPPTISSFTPTDGPAGAEVTIAGINFLGATGVTFNGKSATVFTVDSNTQLRANVPPGATTGKIRVTNADGSALSTAVFTVTAQPIVSSFSPAKAPAGSLVTITGANFTGVTAVAFNGIAASFTLDSNTQLRATVPVGASTGNISVTNSAGIGASVSSFVVQHALTLTFNGSGSVNLNPSGGLYDEGTVVTLTAIPASGWEFSNWGGDLQGTAGTATLTMDTGKRVTVKFKTIPQYTVKVTVAGAGSIVLDPPSSASLADGVYYRDAVVTLTAIPQSGHVFSGYSGDFKGWMNVETITINADKNLTATFSPLPVPRYAKGIWMSAAEVNKLPVTGLGWNNLKAGADLPIGAPNLSDKGDSVNVAVLAKALVYARTGDETYRQSVISTCMAAIGTEQGGETLALGRGLLAYVLAADIAGLPPANDTTFRSWLRNVLTANLQGQTLRSSHETRPNNWGTHCGASRAAIAKYLGDATELERVARVFKGWLGDRSSYADFSYGALDWQADPNAPVGINPLGAILNGRSVDGVLPDDQRRAGGFAWPPPQENYVYEALQGALMQAIILDRAGYDVWNWENQALLRAVKWLHNEANFPADGDDEWLIHIINYFYKTDFPAPFPARPGKNAGWTDWLYGSPYALTVSDNNGDIVIHSLGVAANGLTAMQLAAIPDSGYLFNGWSGDWGGVKNPDTLIMNADKNLAANFVKAGPFTITVASAGAGTVILNPPGSAGLPNGVYYGGTAVTLAAQADSGFQFKGWSGDLSGASNPLQLTITANKNVTATFKAFYAFTVDTAGAGAVTLNPPGGLYEEGTVVTLTATPAAGFHFNDWSGDWTGSVNPTTITMNANKHVKANFAPIYVTHEETRTGGASDSSTVTTSVNLTGAAGQLYLAAISSRPAQAVTAVSGLGLNWTLVKSQCSGRNMTGLEIWMGQGMPSDSGKVTAIFSASPSNAVIAVSRYSGDAAVDPIGSVISGNTVGTDGDCANGVDGKAYLFNLATTVNGALIYSAAAMRNKTHASGAGYVERAEIMQGSFGSAAALATQDQNIAAIATVAVDGAFSGSVDWAIAAVEIKPQTTVSKRRAPDEHAAPVLPSAFELTANYPNPFFGAAKSRLAENAGTMIGFSLPETGKVTLNIYNGIGQLVRTLVDHEMAAGRYSIPWNGRDNLGQTVVAGVYLCRLVVHGNDGSIAFAQTRRMTLVK